jgi:hypothetical protein
MDLSAARGSKQMAQSMEVSVKWEGTVFIVLPSGLSEGPDSRTVDSADLSGEGARLCFFAAKEAAAGVNDGAISS